MATKTLKLGFFSQIQRFFGSKRIRRIHKLALSPDHQTLEPYNHDGPLQRVIRQIQQSPRPLYLGFHEGQCKSEARPRPRATRRTESSTTLCAAPRKSASSTTLCASKVQGTERSSNQPKLPRSRNSSSTLGAALKDTESSIALRTCSSTMRTVVTSLNAGNMQATRDQLMKKLRRKEQRQCVPLESAVSAIRINIGENAGRRSCRRIRVESSKSQMNVARRPSNTKLFCSNSQLSVKASQSRMYSVKPPPAKHCEKDLAGHPGVDVKLAASWFGRMANKDINLDNCRPLQTARAPSPNRSASGSQYPLKKVPSSEKRAQNITNRAPKHSRSLSIYSGKLMPMEVPIKKPISRDLQSTSGMSSKPNESPAPLYPWPNGEIDSEDSGKPIRMELSSSSYPSEMQELQPQSPASLQNEGKLDLKKPIKMECPLQILHQAPKIHKKPSSSSSPATLEEISLLSKRKVNFGTPIRMESPVRFEKPSRIDGKTRDDEKKTLTMELEPWNKPATLLHEILSSAAAKPKLLRTDPWPEAKKSQQNVMEPLGRQPPCTDLCETERKSHQNAMEPLREMPNRTRNSGEDMRLKHIRESLLIESLIARIDKILACPARSQGNAAAKNGIESAELPAKANEKQNTESVYQMMVKTFVNHSYLPRKSLSKLFCPSVSLRPDLSHLSMAMSPFTKKDYTNPNNGAAEKLKHMSICDLMKPFQIVDSQLHGTNTILEQVSRQSERKVDLRKPFWKDYSIFGKPIKFESPRELSLEESPCKEEDGAFDLAEFLKIEAQLKATLAEFTKGGNDIDIAESFEIDSLFPPGTFEPDFLQSPMKITSDLGTSIPISQSPSSSAFEKVFKPQMSTEALEQVLLQADGKPIKMANATPALSIAELLYKNSFQNYIKAEFDLAEYLEIESKTPQMLAKIHQDYSQSGTSFERVVPIGMVPTPLKIASEAPESDPADEEKTKMDLAEFLETESKVQETLDKFVKANKKMDLDEFLAMQSKLLQTAAVAFKQENSTTVASGKSQSPIKMTDETPQPARGESKPQETTAINDKEPLKMSSSNQDVEPKTDNNEIETTSAYLASFRTGKPEYCWNLLDTERKPKRIWTKVAENDEQVNNACYSMTVRSDPGLHLDNNDVSES